jgi:hypothetical protein
VAAKTALNAKNLEALGVERLAELLIEISTGNAAAKRRLRLELAGAQSPAELAKEVRKRLATIARSRSLIDWQGVRSLAEDLDAQRARSSRRCPERTRGKPLICSGASWRWRRRFSIDATTATGL